MRCGLGVQVLRLRASLRAPRELCSMRMGLRLVSVRVLLRLRATPRIPRPVNTHWSCPPPFCKHESKVYFSKFSTMLNCQCALDSRRSTPPPRACCTRWWATGLRRTPTPYCWTSAAVQAPSASRWRTRCVAGVGVGVGVTAAHTVGVRGVCEGPGGQSWQPCTIGLALAYAELFRGVAVGAMRTRARARMLWHRHHRPCAGAQGVCPQ